MKLLIGRSAVPPLAVALSADRRKQPQSSRTSQRIKISACSALAAVCLFLASPIPAAAAASCEALASLKLPHTTITLAQAVEPGKLTLAASEALPPPAAAALAALPAFCRVAATIAPSSDSDIKIEVWMPASGWNGKLESLGNGGWSGAIAYPSLAAALRRGYAAASTDTGHAGSALDGSFALGHPEKLVDFAWRSEHEMTVDAKAIVAAFYGDGPKLSYWNGCSSGGKQGLKEAQRFPADYDGIVAGAPANYWTHLMASGVWIGQATLADAAAYIPQEKYAVIHRAALDACDALDGVKDGVIDDPTQCRFDPGELKCRSDEAPTCLTMPQVEAARKIYAGPTNPRTRAVVFPGLERGSELGWGAMAGGPAPFQITSDHFRFVVSKDAKWDFRTLDFDRDVALADRLDNGLLNATDPDLRTFFARGGKLLLYHGWADQLIAPRNTIDYYRNVLASSGGASSAAGSVRLFMAPGMAHCAGGEGPSSFDALAALEEWVEKGHAPDRLIAAHRTNGVADRTRPLCPYPQTARYNGSGSTDDAANFTCR
jgi:tannase/feruloyl esterase